MPRLSVIALVSAISLMWLGLAAAQDDDETPRAPPKPAHAPKRPTRKPIHPAPRPAAAQAQTSPGAAAPAKPVPVPVPAAQPPGAPAIPPPPGPQAVPAAATAPGRPIFTGQLQQAGVRTCVPLVEQLAGASMQGVTNFNVLSHWMTGGADTRSVSVLVGQQYGGTSNLPNGLTGVFAAPSGPGKCDGLSMQVVPSPLPCTRLRDTIAAHGRQIGDLAGVLVMQDASGQTLLVPTAANTCVLIGTKIVYAK